MQVSNKHTNTGLFTILSTKRLCMGVQEFLSKENKRIFKAQSEDLLRQEFREQLSLSKSALIIDPETYLALLRKKQTRLFEDIPAVILLADAEDIEVLLTLELPENFSLVNMPVTAPAFSLSLKHALDKAGIREENRLARQRYRNLFTQSSQPKLVVDPSNGVIVDANQSAAQLYGLKLNDLIGNTLETIHPERIDTLFEEMKSVLKGNSSFLNLRYAPQGHEPKELEYYVNSVEAGSKSLIYFNIQDNTEREKADQLFYEQHEMLRSTLDSIDDLFFTLNKEGDFIEYYQPSGGNHFNLSSDVFVGRNIYDVGFPLEVAKKYISTIEQVIEEDRSEQIDYYLEAFGSRLWFSARISPRKNALGEAQGVTVLCRDITKQKKTEETLKRARDFYLTLLADFPNMIWKTNTSKRADYFNKTWLEFTGRSLEEELSTDWVEKLHITDVSVFLATLLNAYNKKEAFQIEHRLRHKTGEYRWVLNAGRPFYNLEGQFSGFIGSCYDITERRKAEELLHLQKSAMESALEGILIIEDDNRRYPVIYANNELSAITGITAQDVIAMDFLQVIGNPVLEQTRENIIQSLRNKTSYRGEIECHNGSGSSSWRLLYMAPVNDNGNNVSHFVAVLSDISESKLVEKTLREKNRQLLKTNEELDRFVYSTSHELRSPLMSVLGLVNLLESEQESSEQTVYIDMIRQTISKLDKIIHDIIDYSRNSRLDVVYENIDFQGAVQKAIDNHAYLENFGKVQFEMDVKTNIPFFSDKKRIEIIFNNFISNCIRYHNFAQDTPWVKISVKTSPVNALITISDNGSGIHERHLPKLYEMFYRGTDKSEGSGIGLYIVKEIIDKLQGNIQVNSVSGKGTSFTIDLPNYSLNEPRLLALNTMSYHVS